IQQDDQRRQTKNGEWAVGSGEWAVEVSTLIIVSAIGQKNRGQKNGEWGSADINPNNGYWRIG
ncbi:MAG TPA: hypothetical protein VKS99_07075, partial [Blastocatellia bacterium]|nr:hypothetical protein [Blastocatellia bacterium]